MEHRTSGGLVKHSIQFTPGELAWLREQARLSGHAGVSAMVRKIVDTAMEAERRPERMAS